MRLEISARSHLSWPLYGLRMFHGSSAIEGRLCHSAVHMEASAGLAGRAHLMTAFQTYFVVNLILSCCLSHFEVNGLQLRHRSAEQLH